MFAINRSMWQTGIVINQRIESVRRHQRAILVDGQATAALHADAGAQTFRRQTVTTCQRVALWTRSDRHVRPQDRNGLARRTITVTEKTVTLTINGYLQKYMFSMRYPLLYNPT